MKLSLQAVALGLLLCAVAIVIPDTGDASGTTLEPRANEYCTQNPGKSGTFWLEWQEYVQSTVSIYSRAVLLRRSIASAQRLGHRGREP